MMTIYLEYVFLENLIMDYIILKETMEIAKLKLNNKRIILASIFSSVYVVIMLVFRLKVLNFAVSKLLLATCTIYIAVRLKNVKEYIKTIVLFFMVSVINVGTYISISNIFNISNKNGLEKGLVYIAVYYLAKNFLLNLWKMYRTELNKSELNYTVEINIGGKLYIYTAFLDTGNTVYSHGVPVIFAEVIDEKQRELLRELESFDVKTVTLGNVCTKKTYILEEVKITKGIEKWNVKAGVVFEDRKLSKLNNYNMILNYILYTESMGGIKI